MQSMRRRDCMSRERPQADYKKRLTNSTTVSRRVKCDWPAKRGVVPYKRSVHAATKERVVTKRKRGALGRTGKHVSATRHDKAAEDRGAMAVHACREGRGY